jgi:small conductance mechanosensitive channel
MAVALVAQLAEESSGACRGSPDFICDWVLDITGNPRMAQAVDWIVERPVKVLAILIAAYLLNRLVSRGISRGVERMVRDREVRLREREVDEVQDGRFAVFQHKAIVKARQLAQMSERAKERAQTLGTLLRSLATAVIFGVAVMISLAELDISVGPLIASAGVVGVALGFGAQTIVRDFLAGIFMLVEDQYGVGDIVDLGEASGVVEEVSLRTTRIRDVRGAVWYFPNGEIRRVVNQSQQWARSVLDIEVSYDTDIDRAAQVINEEAESLWREQPEDATILEKPEIWGVERLGESSVAIRLVVKTEPGEQWRTGRELRRRIKTRFDREGIVIPFPQRTVHLHGEAT